MSAGTETRPGMELTSVINTGSCGRRIGGQAFIRPNVNDTTNRHLYRPASKLISLTSCPGGLALSFAHQVCMHSCACRHAGHSRVRFVGLNQTKLLYHIWKRGRPRLRTPLCSCASYRHLHGPMQTSLHHVSSCGCQWWWQPFSWCTLLPSSLLGLYGILYSGM